MITEVLSLPAAALLIYAAMHDVAVRTVPNWLPLTLLGLGVVIRLADHSLVVALLVSAAAFAVLFALWLAGAMGGGDVKLWAATVVLVPPLWQPELNFFLRVVLLGGALAVLYLCLFMVVPKPRGTRPSGFTRRVMRAEAWRIVRRAPLPYACAIAGSAIITLLPLSFQR